MRRKLLNAATALSILVGLLCLALLARSYWICDTLTWARKNGKFVELQAHDGFVILSVIHSDADRQFEWQLVSWGTLICPHAMVFGHPTHRMRSIFIGLLTTSDSGAVLWSPNSRSSIYPIVNFTISWMMLALVAGLLPTWRFLWWIVNHTWKKRIRGLCPICGYDLRATPDRCPECGTPAAVARELSTDEHK